MDRKKLIALWVVAAVVIFLVGFLPQWARANRASERLTDAQFELRLSRVENQIGAALSESLRSNYERARQIMTGVYAEMEAIGPQLDPAQQREVQAMLAQRDEIITLLARAAPESTQRLMLIYTRFHPVGTPGAPAPAPPAEAS